MRIRSRFGVLAALALAAPLSACGQSGGPVAEPTQTPTTPAAATTSASASPSEPSESASSTTATAGATGSPAQPAVLEPVADLLDWTDLPGKVYDTATSNGEWTLIVDEMGASATLTHGGSTTTLTPGKARTFSDGFLDDDWAVLVAQDKQETRPSIATVIKLDDGTRFTIDGSSSQPTTTGGTWALHDGTVLHATIGDGGAYCLASVGLEDQASQQLYCAPKRHGFNQARPTDAGLGLLTFDDSRPSCRTPITLDGSTAIPLPGVANCIGWEGMPLSTDAGDGAIWSVVPKPRHVEQAEIYARSGESWFDLGPGTSGTLTYCDGDAYWSRDPQKIGEPAALMRWDGEQLAVVYEAPTGQSFIPQPRCGGETMNISALAEGGDQQVVALLD